MLKEDGARATAVQNLGEFSLVRNQDTVVFAQSAPRQYVGQLQVTNEIAFLKDVRGYSPNLFFRAVQEGLTRTS